MIDDTPKPAEPVRECSVELTCEGGLWECQRAKLEAERDRMDQLAHEWQSKFAEAQAERDQALRTIAPIHAEVERLRDALSGAKSSSESTMSPERDERFGGR